MSDESILQRLSRAIDEARARIAVDQKIIEDLESVRTLMLKHAHVLAGPQQVTPEAIAAAIKPTSVETKGAQIYRVCEEILSDGRRRLSRELVRELRQRGVVVGGADESGLLASYLSRQKDVFVSDVKAGGWTLRQLTKKVRPDEAVTSSGLVLNG